MFKSAIMEVEFAGGGKHYKTTEGQGINQNITIVVVKPQLGEQV